MELTMSSGSSRPSGWYYGLAALVAVVGLAAAVMVLIRGLSALQSSLIQVVVPGRSEIMLPQPGRYTIFHEHRSAHRGKVYSTEGRLAGLGFLLRSKSTGQKVALAPPSTSSTYSMGGREGVSIFDFNVDQPG